MSRSGLRSGVIRGAEAYPPGPAPEQTVSDSSDEDDEGITANASRRRPPLSRQPTTSNRQTRQNGRQPRSRGLGPYEGKPQEQPPSKKRQTAIEVQLPPLKRRAGLRSGGAEAPPAIEPTEQDGDKSEDEGADEAPKDPDFYHTLNERSRAGLGAPSRPNEQQNDSREAEEQLQKEFREQEDIYAFEGSDDAAGNGRENQPRGVPEPEATGGMQHDRTIRTRGKKAARGKKAKAKPVRKSRRQRTGSVDLATPDEEQAAVSQTPEERGEGDEDEEADKADEDANGEGDNGEEKTVDITSDGLRGMVRLVGHRGWTNEGGQYADELLRQEDESEKEWMGRNSKYLKGDGRCKRLYAEVHHLLKLYQGGPKFPDLDGQIVYLREQKEAIEEAVNAIQASIDGIVTDMEKTMTNFARNVDKRWKWAKEAAKSLYRRIIPLLVLCFKQSFLVGTAAVMEDDTPEEGQFKACTIQPQLVITRWIVLLYDVLRDELENNPPRPTTDAKKEQENLDTVAKQRGYLGKHLDRFHERLKLAKKELKGRTDAPRLRQQAIENDRQAQAAREEKERNMREARDRQMQLFAESTQRMRAAEPRDEYYEKQGWYLWEDERLLDMIRRVVSPDVYALQACLPRRSLEELKRRVVELRDESRRKYEAAGFAPPMWCYSLRDEAV
ncbi:hypothetical protein TOPH_06748 [Tolypocladium ophioglossoides CBS 100239]|uniref:Uncharacterized protein n=1 Tax=Tolypocladium ophioglossoides (strain CBS 100239) TaxID=1163406 RepID=A0A0L0N3M1_TOLOC|nr:hypothetical protein TOPH_06748 [Tolypocladium ophioglossoides CBS 100239]